MNKQVKKLWLDALKSGKYAQGKGRLRKRLSSGRRFEELLCSLAWDAGKLDSYCCFGVLCDLSINHHNSSSRWAGITSPSGGAFQYNNEGSAYEGMPPSGVTDWAGLTTVNVSDLADINDRVRTPENDNFAEVIECIEEDL